jgi:hypothetical protein
VTAADWGLLIPAVVGVLGALAAWLRAQSAHAKINAIQAKQEPKL